MSRFFTGAAHTSLVDEAELSVNAAIKAMNNGGEGAPTAEQVVEFLSVFTNALHRSGGPFKAMLVRGARGPVDPVEYDFLKILATEYNSREVDSNIYRAPLSYYRELMAHDDVSEESMMVLDRDDIALLRSMGDVDAAAFVHDLIQRRGLSDVVCVAKLLFGDKV